ncbi:F0F1 ATP synthase subunit gamma [Natronospirillum operosum]|uniref:ATP synthase gamma chain n=1 Tax=Natronospirillum operosum TaxID=2759953 RepID=A0A4Z0WBD2_9GAMM|nr:F0F1 ATP synthase subunit gamma [Natronospirillum operosum]TGG91466.1 F0F1 ATP synthase subunit gamma [Natronospirillum operosum]
MAAGKEIRSKIGSIKNTQKITSAMEMVAASKTRKAQDRMKATKPYAERMRTVIGHVANADTDYNYTHPYLEQREVQRVGYIVVSTDRGLCGGLNVNMFKAALKSVLEWKGQNVEIEVCAIGKKGVGFFRKSGIPVVGATSGLGDRPEVKDIIGTAQIMLDKYAAGEIDRIYLVGNEFVNTMVQVPRVEQLLPLVPGDDSTKRSNVWDYIYEPDARELLDKMFDRYIEALVYQAVVENLACEQSARMMAMKNATDNAGNLMEELELVYNKARQAAITQELGEIVSGAAAV